MQLKPFPVIRNIHPIVIPLPGFSGLMTSNMYAIGKGPITLIDTSPKFLGSFESVRAQLNKVGFDFFDVDSIIITHSHIDHFGLASSICQAAGHDVKCYIHEQDMWRVSDHYLRNDAWGQDIDDFAAFVDLPPKNIDRIKRQSTFFKRFCDPLYNAYPMKDGDIFIIDDYYLKVIHTPGHSPGSCCLYEPSLKLLFSGDHVIKHITPNPFHEIHRSQLKDPCYQSLAAFTSSLDTISALNVDYVFPGHGEYIDDLHNTIISYKEHHLDRMSKILIALKKGPCPIYNLIDDIFPSINEDDVFLAISEILVHMEILMNEGSVELIKPGPPAVYRALA